MTNMGLLETRKVLNDMIYPRPKRGLAANEVDAIERALREVEVTIDNGDESNW